MIMLYKFNTKQLLFVGLIELVPIEFHESKSCVWASQRDCASFFRLHQFVLETGTHPPTHQKFNFMISLELMFNFVFTFYINFQMFKKS